MGAVTIREQVMEFHRAFGQPVRDVPTQPSQPERKLRIRLIGEEFCELLDALGCDALTVENIRKELAQAGISRKADLVEVADACADLDYVVEGTRLTCGINGEPIAAAVHESNMRKVGATVRADGKIQKPEGWKPPNITRCLFEQGWEP